MRENMSRTPSAFICAALVVAWSGCLSDSPGSDDTTGTAEPPEACAKDWRETLNWALPANYQPPEASGSEPFSIPEGALSSWVNGTSGSFVQARWSFTIETESGEEVWASAVTAPVTAAGSNNNVPSEEVELSAGEYVLQWEVEGAVEELALTIETEGCAPET
jgi:hypothetical protein